MDSTETISRFVVMRLHGWDSIDINGRKLSPQPGGPCGFIPVFMTLEEAEAAKGDGPGDVFEMKFSKKTP